MKCAVCQMCVNVRVCCRPDPSRWLRAPAVATRSEDVTPYTTVASEAYVRGDLHKKKMYEFIWKLSIIY